MAKEKPPIFGMLQRGGEVVIRMLEDVKQVTISPLIKQTIAKGAWSTQMNTTSTADWKSGATATRRSASAGSTPGMTTAMASVRCMSTRRRVLVAASFLAPPPSGIPQESLPLYLGFFEFCTLRAWQTALGALIVNYWHHPCRPGSSGPSPTTWNVMWLASFQATRPTRAGPLSWTSVSMPSPYVDFPEN